MEVEVWILKSSVNSLPPFECVTDLHSVSFSGLFLSLLSSSQARPDVIQLFTANTVSNTMTVFDFKSFLEKNQKETLNDDQVLELIQTLEGDANTKLLSLVGFSAYLCSSDKNGPLDLAKLNEPQDMTQPISHYFISSSHNTYERFFGSFGN